MKLRFGLARGILPYVQTVSPDNWGHAKLFWVRIPFSMWDNKVLRRHEEWHVAQHYTLALIAIALGTMLHQGARAWGIEGPTYLLYIAAALLVALVMRRDGVKLEMEAAAYGESLRALGADYATTFRVATRYAEILTNSDVYALYDPDMEDARHLILTRFEDGRLF
jgi:hypothetical protein